MPLPVIPDLPFDPLAAWLAPFVAHCGERRTARTLTGIVAGILGSGSLVCSRTAAFPPQLAGTPTAERRVRRFVRGEMTQRSALDPDRLHTADDLWLILDGSDLRKPHARHMEALQRVAPLKGAGMVPGYPTLMLLGLGGEGRRGILDHRLYSARADDFVSVPAIARSMITTTGAALAAWTQPVTLIMEQGFDDQAILATAWRQGWHTVWRVMHRDRLVRMEASSPRMCLEALAATTLAPVGRIEAELLVQKTGQARPKRHPVTVNLLACSVQFPVCWHRLRRKLRSVGSNPAGWWKQRMRTHGPGAAHGSPGRDGA